MAVLIGWLLRLVGVGRRPASADARRAPAAPKPDRSAPAAPSPPAAPPARDRAYGLARRRVVVYVARARLPIRQAAAVRQAWLADLSKVYAQIATSPTGLVLEKAGAVGARHEPGFREALACAQAIEPPPEAQRAHAALVGWLTCLHAACLALMDARKVRDRSLLGNFREQLGYARRLAAVLVQERGALFAAYRVTIRPSIKARQPAAAGSDEPPAGTSRPRREAGPRRDAPLRERPAGRNASRSAAASRPNARGKRIPSGRGDRAG